MRIAGRLFLGTLWRLALAVAVLWGLGVLVYAGPGGPAARQALALAFAAVGAVAFVGSFVPRARRRTVGTFAVAFLAVFGWWASLRPSNDREWQPDVQVLTWAEVHGDMVTFHNVRNFDYRTETDYTPAWYDKTYDLRLLDEVDLVASYWMGPDIAHIFLSFGFAGQDYLAISIETRKEVGERYSTLAGFFRQYELYYVVADERDVIRVRTNYRKAPPEDVYLYRVAGTPERARHLLLDYVRSLNALRERPEWYNALTTNCTTAVLTHTHVNPGSLPMSWKVLVSGHTPEYAHENGRLASTVPFPVLQRRSRINDVARAADAAPDFSRRIRASLPWPSQPDAAGAR